jgi:hypothetical protein
LSGIPQTGTTIIIVAESDPIVMTAEALPRPPKDHHGKKNPGRPVKKNSKSKDMLYAVAEHSLSGFLEDEPDLYSVADVKVRYR